MTDAERLLRQTCAAFNARDIASGLGVMHADVDWPNGMEGGRVRGHDAVRDYWTRQWKVIAFEAGLITSMEFEARR